MESQGGPEYKLSVLYDVRQLVELFLIDAALQAALLNLRDTMVTWKANHYRQLLFHQAYRRGSIY